MSWRVVIALVVALGLAGCGKPEVTGSVLPSEAERSGVPWLRVEVRLIRGALMDQLPQLAAQRRNEAMAVAQQRVLESAKAERDARADALHRARAAFVTNAGDGNGSPETDAGSGCLPQAEARLAAAKRDYRDSLTALLPRIAAVGVAADSPERALKQLRAAVQAKRESEARRSRDDYLRAQIVQQSGTVLTTGSKLDRLCWKVQNKRDVGVRFRGLTVLYNGRPLPDAVAQQLWRLPAKQRPLRIPNSLGADNDVLLPGAAFEACFYSRGTALAVDLLRAHGLSATTPTRSGEWRVQWDDIDLVGTPAAAGGGQVAPPRRQPEAVPLVSVFTDRLGQLDAESEESRLIAAITDSDSTRAVSQAELTLVACHRVIAAMKAYDDVERAVQAIERGDTTELAVAVRLRPVLQQLVREPNQLAKWLAEADAFVESQTVARQEQELGQVYRFVDVEPGQYTLLAKSVLEATKPKLWLIPLGVDGPVAQDLVASAARDMGLRKALENVLLGEPSLAPLTNRTAKTGRTPRLRRQPPMDERDLLSGRRS
jgi:hypothetical protein